MSQYPEYMDIASELMSRYIGQDINDELKKRIAVDAFTTLTQQFPQLSDLSVYCQHNTNSNDLSLVISSSDGDYDVRLSPSSVINVYKGSN
jgi:hypothetical protein